MINDEISTIHTDRYRGVTWEGGGGQSLKIERYRNDQWSLIHLLEITNQNQFFFVTAAFHDDAASHFNSCNIKMMQLLVGQAIFKIFVFNSYVFNTIGNTYNLPFTLNIIFPASLATSVPVISIVTPISLTPSPVVQQYHLIFAQFEQLIILLDWCRYK